MTTPTDMGLDLDERQRAMLEEMHVRVWWPLAAPVAVAQEPAKAETPPLRPVPVVAPRKTQETPVSALHVAEHAPVFTAVESSDLAALSRSIASCQACGLCAGRRNPVFAPAQAERQTDWMLVGEPPDEEEEQAGEPFQGRAGLLLDNMLRAVQVSRTGAGNTGAWLSSVVKCRPAQPRNPAPEELQRCAEHLRREVALLRPKVILAMGRFATQSLLGPGNPEFAGIPFGKLRGTVHRFEGVPVVVTYPVARLLRAPEDKARAWADLCLAKQLAGGGE